MLIQNATGDTKALNGFYEKQSFKDFLFSCRILCKHKDKFMVR